MSAVIEESILAEKMQLRTDYIGYHDAFTPGPLQQYGRIPVGKWMYVIDFVSCVAQRL
jgi:hypothetical protein